MTERLEIPFDVMDGLAATCIPGFAPGFMDFRREQVDPGRVIYHLLQDNLGELGTLEIVDAGDGVTLEWKVIPVPGQEMTERRQAHLANGQAAFWSRMEQEQRWA